MGWHVDLLDRVDTALNLITRFGPLDISLKPSGTDGYDDLAAAAVEFTLADTSVPTASLDDIVRSKTAAGRAKDNLALPVLLRFLRRRSP